MFEKLAEMEYPGRVIIIGQNSSGLAVALYAITGRSESSQARRLVISDDHKSIVVQVTDEDLLKKGNPDLLIYPAIILKDKHVIVSNGKQTDDIAKVLDSNVVKRFVDPKDILEMGLKSYTYEPDDPNFTPRISGCNYDGDISFSIIKRIKCGKGEGEEKIYYNFEPFEGEGKMIATYTGINIDPLPSFEGEPIEIELNFNTVKEAVEAAYRALGPQGSKPDFRVSVAGISYNHGDPHFREVYIKNRHDL